MPMHHHHHHQPEIGYTVESERERERRNSHRDHDNNAGRERLGIHTVHQAADDSIVTLARVRHAVAVALALVLAPSAWHCLLLSLSSSSLLACPPARRPCAHLAHLQLLSRLDEAAVLGLSAQAATHHWTPPESLLLLRGLVDAHTQQPPLPPPLRRPP